MTQTKQRVALVTGASGGIGNAIARRIAADDTIVVVHFGSDENSAAKTVAEIEAAKGTAVAYKANLTDKRDVESLFTKVDRAFGRLDILVNNAGIAEAAPLEEISEDMLDALFAVNVKGVVFASQQAANRMGEGGRIINISSSSVDFPLEGLSAYAASKAASKIFTEIWAKELAVRGITVNSVVPGPTSPGMIDNAPQAVRDQVSGASPFQRMGSAAEVANVVAFLASGQASWVSGEHIRVNGAGSI